MVLDEDLRMYQTKGTDKCLIEAVRDLLCNTKNDDLYIPRLFSQCIYIR